MTKFHQGVFTPKHPEKYKGNVNNIIYRSGWERTVLMKLDNHPDVFYYASEEIIVKYMSPIDKRQHRYYVDFIVKYKTRAGVVRTVLLEVKPYKQTLPPVKGKGKKAETSYAYQVATFIVNQAKWAAAREVCKKNGWTFELITERELRVM